MSEHAARYTYLAACIDGILRRPQKPPAAYSLGIYTKRISTGDGGARSSRAQAAFERKM
jgi:hypothetical protein